LALAQRERGTHVPAVQQWATRLQTAYSDLVIDGERLLGRPRDAVGYVREVTGESLAGWAAAEIPPWQFRDMQSADWAEVVQLLAAWVRQRDAAVVADTPHDARVHAQLREDRARAERRAQLAEQQAAAAAELARLDDPGEPVDADPPRRGGWLRRSPTP